MWSSSSAMSVIELMFCLHLHTHRQITFIDFYNLKMAVKLYDLSIFTDFQSTVCIYSHSAAHAIKCQRGHSLITLEASK